MNISLSQMRWIKAKSQGGDMMESLLQASNILLFGVVVEDLIFETAAADPDKGKKLPKRKGNNNQLGEQVTPDSKFARIYAFSYEGAFYELPWPALFLVHKDGEKPRRASAR